MYLSIHPFNPIRGDKVVLAIRAIGFGQLDGVSFDVIDSADLFSA